MKLSEIKLQDVVSYCRCEEDEKIIEPFFDAAIDYVKDYTGMSIEQMEEKSDITIAVLCVCSELYDSRSVLSDRDKVNKLIEGILNLHDLNLL